MTSEFKEKLASVAAIEGISEEELQKAIEAGDLIFGDLL